MGHVIYATARVSVPTVWQGMRGQLEPSVCNRRLDEWSAQLVAKAGLQLEISGQEHATGGRAFIVMSNHQSHFDIPVLYQSLPMSMRMVVKKELFRIPLWSSAMRAAQFIEIDRSKGAVAYEKLAKAGRELLESGLSLWISPEGTRNPDGTLLPFKRGGFRLAMASGLPILPVTIDGTRHVHRKGSWSVRRGCRVRVIIHPPIDVRSLEKSHEADEDAILTELMERTRRAIGGPLSVE